MANCVRCGRKLPAFSLGKVSDTCRACRQAGAVQASNADVGNARHERASLRRVSPATSAIIGLNALMLAGMTVSAGGKALFDPSNDILLRWGADWGPRTLAGEPWRAFTSMWVHGGAVHLILNMWCLDTYGRLAERLFGWRFYLTVYVLAGLCGSIASLAWHPNVVSVGASAAVFGVVGALFLPFRSGRLAIPPQALRAAGRSLLAFVGYNLIMGMVIPEIDNAAHLGGLLGGFVLGAMWTRRISKDKRWIQGGAAVAALIVICLFFAVRQFRFAATLTQQAIHLFNVGRTEEAFAMATAAVAHDDRDAVAHAVMGAAFSMKNENERAVEEFEEALRILPDYEYALSELGRAYDLVGRTFDAVRVLERAVKLDKDDSDAWTNLGIAFWHMGSMEEAARALETAVQKDPRRAFAHDALGILLQGRNRIDPALDSFRKAVQLQPENKDFRAHLADALDAKGLREEAERVRRQGEPER